jgi:hypothetical protein
MKTTCVWGERVYQERNSERNFHGCILSRDTLPAATPCALNGGSTLHKVCRFHNLDMEPETFPSLMSVYIGVARATSSKLRPGPPAPCCCNRGLLGAEVTR